MNCPFHITSVTREYNVMVSLYVAQHPNLLCAIKLNQDQVGKNEKNHKLKSIPVTSRYGYLTKSISVTYRYRYFTKLIYVTSKYRYLTKSIYVTSRYKYLTKSIRADSVADSLKQISKIKGSE